MQTTTAAGDAVPSPRVPEEAPGPRGGEVPPGPRTPSLSPSRASDFLACPLRYRLRVVDRIPEPAHPEAVRGTVVHAVLERLFDVPATQRTLAHARSLIESAWAEVRAADPRAAELAELTATSGAPTEPGTATETATVPGGPTAAPGVPGTSAPTGEGAPTGPDSPTGPGAPAEPLPAWLGTATELLGTYFALEDPTRLEPAEREVRIETVLADGLRLRGFVDRLDVAPGGAIRIVDYKTGRSPGPGFEARALFQMRFYALVVWRLRGVLPTLLQLMYLGDGTVVRYAPDEGELLATERKLRAIWRAVETSMERKDFRPNPGRLCDWCDHKVRCPAFGGELPPYPVDRAEPAGRPADVPARSAARVLVGSGGCEPEPR